MEQKARKQPDREPQQSPVALAERPLVSPRLLVLMAQTLQEERAEAAVHTSPQSLAWREPPEDSRLVAVAAALRLTTALRLALVVLAALVQSTSSPIANP